MSSVVEWVEVTEPFKFTLMPWRAKPRRAGTAVDQDGVHDAVVRWEKIFALARPVETYLYGTVTRCEHPDQQVGQVCSPEAGLLVIDVDNDEAFRTTNTADALDNLGAQPFTRRGTAGNRHYWVDARRVPRDRWPRQGRITGGDVKANGFVPIPGSLHPSGDLYEPVLGEHGELTLIELWPGDELHQALLADRADASVGLPSGTGGGTGNGNDSDLFSFTGAMVAAGETDKERAWQKWLTHAQKNLVLSDPSWPWTEANRDRFEHHWEYCVKQHAVNHPPFEVTLPTVNATSPAPSGFAVLQVGTEESEETDRDELAASESDDGPPTPHALNGPPPDGTEPDHYGGETDFMRAARRLDEEWCVSDGTRGLVWWREEWRAWTGTHWGVVTPARLKSALYARLEEATYLRRVGRGAQEQLMLTEWSPNRHRVANVVDALEAVTYLSETVEARDWLSGEPAEETLVAVANGLLGARTRELRPPTPVFFNLTALPFSFDAEARCPKWDAYLKDVFNGDEESPQLLQEWAGYCVSGRTDLQKLLFLVGPRRSGKGTFARILAELLGRENVVGPTLNGFTSQFGMASFIDKSLAVFDDVRAPDPRRVDLEVVVERLLSIVGEGTLDVDRKNRMPWTGRLSSRIMMMSNELMQLPDAAGALSGRTLIVKYERSYEGEEVTDLWRRFVPELPGILNWALDGLDRLNALGWTRPGAAAEEVEELGDLANPILPFLREDCRLGPEETVTVEDLFQAWAARHGGFKDEAAQKMRFGRLLKGAIPHVKKQKRMVGGRRSYYYDGIGLAHPLPSWAAASGGH